MSRPTRHPGHLLAAMALLVPATIASAQKPADSAAGYPAKSVRLVVPLAPGGGTDAIARIVAQKMGEIWPHAMIVENQGGGGTTIGTHAVVRSPADGYTLLMNSIAIAFSPALYRDLPYSVERDLAPVVQLATQPSMLVVHPSLPVKSIKQLIALAKARPGEILYSSGGVGSASHLPVELFRSAAGIKLVHVPYKGGGPAGVAAMTGEVQMTITNVSSLLPHVKAGKLRALAVTAAERAKAAPEIPTVAESGLPGYKFALWYGVFAPARTPPAIIRKANEGINRALAAPDIQGRLAKMGIEPVGGDERKFAAYVATEVRQWAQVVKDAGIRAD